MPAKATFDKTVGLHIIIDGYNLIRRSPAMARLDRRDLEAGRMALVKRLAAYKKVKHHRLTVVFDGAGGPAGLLRRDRIRGIEIHFSGPGETADTLIKRMVRNAGDRVLVVSSDREVTGFAAAAGADTLESELFEQRLAMAEMMELKGPADEVPERQRRLTTRKKGPARRLSKKQRRQQRMLAKL